MMAGIFFRGDKTSLTNPKDFVTLWALIPKNKRKNIWFFTIRQNKKNPDVPSGTVLKGNMAYRLDFNEALHRMKWGSNVGIYAITGGLMFLDLDVSEGKLLASESFLSTLESIPTLTIKTRNGGIQKYFWNNGEYPNQLIKENDITIGELRTDWYYVVSVGSHVEPDEHCRGEQDGTYRIIEEQPISDFKGFGDYFKKNEEVKKEELKTFSKKTDSGAIQLEEYLKNIEQKGKHRREASIFERKFLLNRMRFQ